MIPAYVIEVEEKIIRTLCINLLHLNLCSFLFVCYSNSFLYEIAFAISLGIVVCGVCL